MNLFILVIIVIVIIVIFCNKIRIEKYSNDSSQIDNIFKKYITKSKFAHIIGESVPPLLIENVISGIKDSMQEYVPTTLFPIH